MAKNRKHVTLGDISSMLNKHFIKYVKSEKSIKALKNVKADDLIILNNRSDFKMYGIVASGGSGSIPTANGMYANPIDISGTADINSAINARVKYSDISQTMNTGVDKVPSMALISSNDQLYARVSQIVNDFVTGGANTLASGNTVKLLYQLIQNMGEGGAVKLEYYLQRASQSRLTSIGTLAKGTTTIVPSQGVIISPMVFLNDELLVPTTDYTIDAATTSITLTRARNYDGMYFIIDDYMPKYKFSVQSVDYLLGSNLLKAKLMIDDVIDIQGDVESYDGGHHMRIVQATSGLNGVLVKDGMYLNEIPNTRIATIREDLDCLAGGTIGKNGITKIQQNGTKYAGHLYKDVANGKMYLCTVENSLTVVDSTKFRDVSNISIDNRYGESYNVDVVPYGILINNSSAFTFWRVRKLGSMVSVSMDFIGGTLTSIAEATIIGNFPENLRPKHRVFGIVVGRTGGLCAIIEINMDGRVLVVKNIASEPQSVFGHVSYCM